MKKHQQTRRNHLNHVLIKNVSFKNWTDNWEKKFCAPTKVGVSIICFKISKSTDEQTAIVQQCFLVLQVHFFNLTVPGTVEGSTESEHRRNWWTVTWELLDCSEHIQEFLDIFGRDSGKNMNRHQRINHSDQSETEEREVTWSSSHTTAASSGLSFYCSFYFIHSSSQLSFSLLDVSSQHIHNND